MPSPEFPRDGKSHPGKRSHPVHRFHNRCTSWRTGPGWPGSILHDGSMPGRGFRRQPDFPPGPWRRLGNRRRDSWRWQNSAHRWRIFLLPLAGGLPPQWPDFPVWFFFLLPLVCRRFFPFPHIVLKAPGLGQA